MFIKTHTTQWNNILMIRSEDIKMVMQQSNCTLINTYNGDKYSVQESAEYIRRQAEGVDSSLDWSKEE